MAMAEMPGPYDVRHYDCRARGVVTNTCTMAPYRGVSRPIITFTLERLMDKAAARLRHRPGRYPPPQPDRQIPLHLGDGADFRRGAPTKRRWRWRSRRSTCRPSASASKQRAPAGPLSRHRLCDLLRAHRLRHAGFRRARHGDHAGLGDRRSSPSIRPAPSKRASAPRRTARACARRWRRSSPTSSASRRRQIKVVHGDTDRDALRLGHFRQPLAGDLRRRHADRRAQGARQADQDRQPPAGSGARRHRARRRRGQGRRHRPRRSRSPSWRARPITQTHRFNGGSSPA